MHLHCFYYSAKSVARFKLLSIYIVPCIGLLREVSSVEKIINLSVITLISKQIHHIHKLEKYKKLYQIKFIYVILYIVIHSSIIFLKCNIFSY